MMRLGLGRIPISLTIVTTFVGLVTVMLGSVLAVSYFASLRNTEGLLAELAIQSNGIVTEELHDYLGPVADQVNWIADLIIEDSLNRADDNQIRSVLSAALAATPQVTVLAYISADALVIDAYRGELGDDGRLDMGPSEDSDFAGLMLQTSQDRKSGFWNGPAGFSALPMVSPPCARKI